MSEINGVKVSISAQNPIKISDTSEPEPDIVIAKFRKDDYILAHPSAEDIYCLIEVSDSTLEKDREVKKPLYASAGISEYWIVNLVDKQIEIYRQPKNGEYHFKQIISQQGSIKCETVEFTLEYDQIFPKE